LFVDLRGLTFPQIPRWSDSLVLLPSNAALLQTETRKSTFHRDESLKNPFAPGILAKNIGTRASVPARDKHRLLPEKYRRTFANKQIVCVEYSDIADSDDCEIFR
jgi:hypothetical protein